MNIISTRSRQAVCRLIIILLAGCFYCQHVKAQPVLTLTPVIQSGLSAPIQFVNAGDGSKRVFIVQQGATIRVYDSAFNFLSVFLTVSNVNVGGERGLLSMAFHPDYANNGFFYVYYTNTAGNLEIARYHVSSDPNVADAASKVVVITIPHPTYSNHNGGELHFNNADGYLYLSTGDGGGGGDQSNNAQNTSVLLGKMLRFNVNLSTTPPYYSIPAGNPYGNEIFDLGLRNPYRWSFDRLTNDMWIGDVGQDSYEEIDYRAAGSTGGVNYGWRCYEGNNPYNSSGCGPAGNYVFPAFTYPSQNPSAAITGGLVYRGAMQALYGYYVAADFYSGNFYMISPDGLGGWTTLTQEVTPKGIVDFGESENGELYVVSLTSNAVYRVNAADGGPLPVRLADFTVGMYHNLVQLKWQTALEQNLQQFNVEFSTDGYAFNPAGTVQAGGRPGGGAYVFDHAASLRGTVFYRLKMINTDGSYRYSGMVRINIPEDAVGIVQPTIISNGIVQLNLNNSMYEAAVIINETGTIVAKQKIKGQTGRVGIPVSNLSPGIYMVKLTGVQVPVYTQKILIQ